MIQSLRNKHEGSTIAIIGSGLTSSEYSEDEDVAIALNGALQLPKRLDYFQAFDTGLPTLSWYHIKPEITRIIGAGMALCDKFLYPSMEERKKFGGHTVRVELPKPAEPHLWFWYQRPEEVRLNIDLEGLDTRGNIAICAIQTAVIMGAKEIHLYGIGMGPRGYFYERERKGDYTENSALYMQALINLIRDKGIIVTISNEPGKKIG